MSTVLLLTVPYVYLYLCKDIISWFLLYCSIFTAKEDTVLFVHMSSRKGQVTSLSTHSYTRDLSA